MIEPKDVKVLIGCEESQRVCRAFRKLGFEAYSCDIQPPSGSADEIPHPEWHILKDLRKIINGGMFDTMDGKIHYARGWTLGIFHPPCTYACTASACRLFHKDPLTGNSILDEKRYRKGLEMRKLFMKCLNAKYVRFKAVENPTSMSIWNLPEASQVI